MSIITSLVGSVENHKQGEIGRINEQIATLESRRQQITSQNLLMVCWNDGALITRRMAVKGENSEEFFQLVVTQLVPEKQVTTPVVVPCTIYRIVCERYIIPNSPHTDRGHNPRRDTSFEKRYGLQPLIQVFNEITLDLGLTLRYMNHDDCHFSSRD